MPHGETRYSTQASAAAVKTVIVSAAKAGHVNQCLAVCERLGWRADELVRIPSGGRMTPVLERRGLAVLRAFATWRARPRARTEPGLRMVASGEAAERVVAAYRALYGDALFAVFSGRPRWRESIFDLALVPRHSLSDVEPRDGFTCPAARSTILRRGTPVRAAPVFNGERRFAFAMVGGLNKAFDIDPAAIARQVQRMLDREDARPFVMTFSRRTPALVEASLRHALGPKGVAFVDRADRDGFERALAEAADYVVTPDSLTMICEACDTGRPVRVFDLPCFDPFSTTAVCVRDLIEGGEIAVAPDGAPRPQEPGRFRVPDAVVDVYRGWEAGRARAAESVPRSPEQAAEP